MNGLDGPSAVQVLGAIDAAKFRSCLTLFRSVDPADAVWGDALDRFFGGIPDARTLAMLDVAQRES
jgi:uncharacterized protein (DUF1810 family)